MSRPRSRTTPGIGRSELLLVAGTTTVFLLLLVTWAYVNPALHGPDEVANVDAVVHLALGQPWPATGDLHYVQGLLAQNVPAHLPPAVQRGTFADIIGDGTLNPRGNPMSQHPPTYFLVQAAVAHLIDFGSRRWDLVVLVMRLVDVVVAAPLPVLVWASVRRATRSPRLAVAAAAVLLAVPQVVQLASSVSLWVPVITAGALATWLAVRVLTGDRSWLTAVALGGALSVGTAVMAGGWMAVPFALVTVLAARRSVRAAREVVGRVLRALVVLAVPVVTTGWWYARQFIRTGSPQPDPFAPVTKQWPAGEGPDPVQFGGTFWNGISDSFWGQLGRYEWPLSPIIVDSATVIALTAVVWAASRRTVDRRTMLVVGVFPATALVVVLARDWATYVGHLSVRVDQGRFLFPALAALLVVQAVGWRGLVVREQVRVRLARAVLVVAPLIALAALGLLYVGSFEEFVFRVSAAGKQTLWDSLPVGRGVLGGLVVLTAVVGAATAVSLWRWFGRRTAPAPATAPARLPADRRTDH
ncbi:hypothetical protein GCM10009706_00720 [Curtobacterium citreum]|uniref:Glycosyltransferase RgtA/B/C/D-like domain-containing protein n=1 Tax=Curtobacterium citreum TaxID=2036 RepID=A0ABT2HHB0_9MICO|nr:hypothetical protein [Curtobacterium citreum]MCS6522656.1 hypothetical protein [Curtobacterium citreum]TQJ28564.1 hypothetical protein FB462_2457 [Curtobacterium citreum]GGL66078.1 hypothetical protein GCM10009706_00720 [Curtobacterium citreum]